MVNLPSRAQPLSHMQLCTPEAAEAQDRPGCGAGSRTELPHSRCGGGSGCPRLGSHSGRCGAGCTHAGSERWFILSGARGCRGSSAPLPFLPAGLQAKRLSRPLAAGWETSQAMKRPARATPGHRSTKGKKGLGRCWEARRCTLSAGLWHQDQPHCCPRDGAVRTLHMAAPSSVLCCSPPEDETQRGRHVRPLRQARPRPRASPGASRFPGSRRCGRHCRSPPASPAAPTPPAQFRSLVLLLPKHGVFGSVHLLRFTLRRMQA